MAKTSTITFDQFGGMQVDHVGFTGKACQDMTDKLVGGLGATVVKDTKKPEFNQTTRGGARATIGGK